MNPATFHAHRRLRADRPLGLRADACLPLNFSYASCRECERACPVGALRVGGDEITVGVACTGCGRCAATCTTGALRIEGCDVPESLPPEVQRIHVECRKVPVKESLPNDVRVPCIGALAVSQWLGLVRAADGRPVEVVDRGWCARCDAGGAHLGRGSLDEARALLAKMNLPADRLLRRSAAPLPLYRMPRAIPAATAPAAMSRRGFFGHLARGATATASVAAAAAQAPAPKARAMRPGALAIPERERRLELADLIARRAGAALPAPLFPALAVTDACRNHNVCAALCPTQALHPYRDGECTGIAFDAAACIACGACVTGCPEKAIALDARGAAPAAEAVRLTSRRVHECRDCGAAAEEAGGLCDACRRSEELAAEVFAPIST